MIRERTESPSRPAPRARRATGGATDTSSTAEVRREASPATAAVRGRHESRRGHAPVGDAAYSERRFVPRGPEIHAKLPPARHTVQRPPRRPHADASLRRRITRARPLPRAETAHVARTSAHPWRRGRRRPATSSSPRICCRADAQFRGRQATFKRYSATSIDELHPRLARAGVLRRRKVPRVHGPQDAHPEASTRPSGDQRRPRCARHPTTRPRSARRAAASARTTPAARRSDGTTAWSTACGAASPSWTPRPRATRSSRRGSPRTTPRPSGRPGHVQGLELAAARPARTCDARPGCLSGRSS